MPTTLVAQEQPISLGRMMLVLEIVTLFIKPLLC
jgi:hypothetical protein